MDFCPGSDMHFAPLMPPHKNFSGAATGKFCQLLCEIIVLEQFDTVLIMKTHESCIYTTTMLFMNFSTLFTTAYCAITCAKAEARTANSAQFKLSTTQKSDSKVQVQVCMYQTRLEENNISCNFHEIAFYTFMYWKLQSIVQINTILIYHS